MTVKSAWAASARSSVFALAVLLWFTRGAAAVPGQPLARVFFEENRGQWSGTARYGARTASGTVLLEPARITLRGRCGDTTLQLIGGRSSAFIEGQRQASTVNYFLGNDPAAWLAGVPAFERVRTGGVLPGVDVEYYAREGEIEFDLRLDPGTRPESIRFRVQGARSTRVDSGGDLVVQGCGSEFRFRAPVSWQEGDLERRPVNVVYSVERGDVVRLRARSPIDPGLVTIIDPVISFLTYYGGDKTDGITSIGRDAGGNIFIAGNSSSSSLPAQDRVPAPHSDAGTNWNDAFVAKLTPSGDRVLWTTWIGGAANELLHLAVDQSGSVAVGGYTRSADFPMKNALQPTLGGAPDAVVGKLNTSGVIEFMTFFGGPNQDAGNRVALDPSGNIVLAGQTDSPNLIPSPLFPLNGQSDAFIAKFAPDGSRLIAGTYFGSSAQLDGANGLAVAPNGDISIAGYVTEGMLPVKNALQPVAGGGTDTYIAKFDGSLTELLFATYLGGLGHDNIQTLAADGTALIAAGSTQSPNLPVKNAVDATLSGFNDIYVIRIEADGTSVTYATYYGGSAGGESIGGMSIDASGNVWLGGATSSADFPQHRPLSISPPRNGDGVVVKLSPGGQVLFSTTFGGEGFDQVTSIDAAKTPALLGGSSASSDLPVRNAAQPHKAGEVDAFVLALGEDFTGSGEERIVPIVASAPGAAGSFFRTTVQLHNPHASEIGGRLVFHHQGESGTANDPSLSFFIGAGQTLSFRDLLPALGRDGVGSIDMVTLPGAAPLTVARIFNDGGERGTTGMTQGARPPSSTLQAESRSVILVPPDLTQARFNIGVRSLEAGAVLDVTLRRANGTVAGSVRKSYPASYFLQSTAEAFLGIAPQANDSIEISVASGAAIVYGAATDNITQDPSMQLAERVGAQSGRAIVPVVASAPGALGSYFRAAMQVHNASDQPSTVRLIFHPANRSGSATDPLIEVVLAARETRSWPDLLPAMGQGGLGSLDVDLIAGVLPIVVARIYNDAGSAGTTGMTTGLIASSSAAAAGASVVLIAPADNLAARFNLGLRTFEAGARIGWTLRNAAGAAIGSGTLEYPAEYFTQQAASAILGLPLGDNDSITFTVQSGSAVIYGAATDNITQDPSLQMAATK